MDALYFASPRGGPDKVKAHRMASGLGSGVEVTTFQVRRVQRATSPHRGGIPDLVSALDGHHERPSQGHWGSGHHRVQCSHECPMTRAWLATTLCSSSNTARTRAMWFTRRAGTNPSPPCSTGRGISILSSWCLWPSRISSKRSGGCRAARWRLCTLLALTAGLALLKGLDPFKAESCRHSWASSRSLWPPGPGGGSPPRPSPRPV